MQFILSLFNRVDTALLAISAFVGAIVGIIKSCQFLWGIIKNKMRQRKENKQIPERMMNKMNQLSKSIVKISNDMKSIDDKIKDIDTRLKQNDDATSTIMLKDMMSAYQKYVINKEPIDLNVRTALCVMFDQYTEGGRHNHVPSDFKDRIMECEMR